MGQRLHSFLHLSRGGLHVSDAQLGPDTYPLPTGEDEDELPRRMLQVSAVEFQSRLAWRLALPGSCKGIARREVCRPGSAASGACCASAPFLCPSRHAQASGIPRLRPSVPRAGTSGWNCKGRARGSAASFFFALREQPTGVNRGVSMPRLFIGVHTPKTRSRSLAKSKGFHRPARASGLQLRSACRFGISRSGVTSALFWG